MARKMNVKLYQPFGEKNWNLQFTNIHNKENELINNPEKTNIWFWCRLFGELYKTNPFLQGNHEDWMMIEFRNSSQSLIFETCQAICNKLQTELQL